MTAKNDVTDDLIYSSGYSEEWDMNYEKVFGYKKVKSNPLNWDDATEERDCDCCGKVFMGNYTDSLCRLCSN